MRSTFQRWATRVAVITTLAASSYSPSAASAGIQGSADGLAVVGAPTLASTGVTIITGDLGLAPSTAVTGLNSVALTGTATQTDGTGGQAQADALTAYTAFARRPSTSGLAGHHVGGLAVMPGVYNFSSPAQLTGALALGALSDSDTALLVFQTGSALTTASGTAIRRLGGTDSRVSWQVGGSPTADDGSGTDPGSGPMEDAHEPGTVSLFCLGLLALTLYAWQSRKRLA